MTDSHLDTLLHSRRVDELMLELISALQYRLTRHDASKMGPPEKPFFDEYGPELRSSTYGSEKYIETLLEMKPGLVHHYASNRHHPEHYANGINGMTLVDLMEMLADWKAATERHDDGSLVRSLGIQKKRFEISDQLFTVLANTAREFGWI